MSGLLQRLAARATGSAWALRSDARLPFAGNAAGMAEASPQVPDARTAPPPSRKTGAGQPPVARHTQAPAPMAADAPLRADMHSHQPTTTPSRPQHTPVTTIGAKAASMGRPGTDGVPQVMRSDTPCAATANTPAPGPLAATDPAPLLPLQRGRGPAGTSAAASASQGKLHPEAADAPGALTPLPRPQPFTAPLKRADAAEVHIHIDRIEVTTAAPEPQAPRRQARERTQPLSLDAYLARRKEPS
ncbi:hypothetical protein [Alicycliphilus denitrificans]|uniref:hypothetical protein n=1 Tax=Alicycliphilus denitrificans TaxID=179636 RepID=UPI00384B2ABA